MIEVKPWYKSRVVGLATLQGIAGVLTAIFSVDPALQTIGCLAVIKSIVDFLLRLDTTKTIV